MPVQFFGAAWQNDQVKNGLAVSRIFKKLIHTRIKEGINLYFLAIYSIKQYFIFNKCFNNLYTNYLVPKYSILLYNCSIL